MESERRKHGWYSMLRVRSGSGYALYIFSCPCGDCYVLYVFQSAIHNLHAVYAVWLPGGVCLHALYCLHGCISGLQQGLISPRHIIYAEHDYDPSKHNLPAQALDRHNGSEHSTPVTARFMCMAWTKALRALWPQGHKPEQQCCDPHRISA